MNRIELEGLDREGLIARAEAAGIPQARILTRPELVDELLVRGASDRASAQRARGLFGRARDLLARVVERGLNLPDAAERIRAVGGPISTFPTRAQAAVPTVTLAEIYAGQGHRARAIETLDRVLVREPDHAAASALLEQLRDDSYPLPPPRMPPELDDQDSQVERELANGDVERELANGDVERELANGDVERELANGEGAEVAADRGPAASGSDALPTSSTPANEPMHMLDDAPLPPRYDVDECVAIPVDPRTLYIYWEVRQRTLDYVRALRPGGTIALRVVVVVPTWDGPRSSAYDHDVRETLGDHFERGLPPGCIVRVAIGYRLGDTFVAIAHSPALDTPPGAPSPLVGDVLIRWTPQGAFRFKQDDADAPSIMRALERVRRELATEGARAWQESKRRDLPLGSSESFHGTGSSEAWSRSQAGPRP